MKIAGVSVNQEALPEQSKLIEKALKTAEYNHMDKKDATVLIKKAIKDSGLYKKL